MDLSTHGIVALVRNSKSKFLLLEDVRKPMQGCWAPRHGRCQQTDVSEEASVIREVKEETGPLVKPIRKVFTQPADTKIKTVSFWSVEGPSDEVVLNEESSAFGWYDVDEILRLRL